MCEILTKSVDATHPDPMADLAGCYKRNDPVRVEDDDFDWGRKERDPARFAVVKLRGVPGLVVSALTESQVHELNPVEPVVVRRRRYSIALDDMPEPITGAGVRVPSILRRLNGRKVGDRARQTGKASLSLRDIENYTIDKAL